MNRLPKEKLDEMIAEYRRRHPAPPRWPGESEAEAAEDRWCLWLGVGAMALVVALTVLFAWLISP